MTAVHVFRCLRAGWELNLNNFKTKPNHLTVLKHLVATNSKQSTYTLFKKIRVPVADFMQTLVELQRAGFIQIESDIVSATTLGFSRLARGLQEPARNEHSGYLANVPLLMRSDQRVDIHEPYIPSKSRLHKILLEG